jgi:hypothetical protein
MYARCRPSGLNCGVEGGDGGWGALKTRVGAPGAWGPSRLNKTRNACSHGRPAGNTHLHIALL